MQLTLTLPDELVANFKSEDDLRRTLYEDFIIEQRQVGAISLSKAAELLGVTYEEFFALLGRKGLSFVNVSAEEAEASYRALADLMGQR
jgi:predicted HTH domain antitoxin